MDRPKREILKEINFQEYLESPEELSDQTRDRRLQKVTFPILARCLYHLHRQTAFWRWG